MAGLFLLPFCGRTASFNVRDYGAKADKTNNDSPSFQAAIDACNQAGGGDVVVPAGSYLVGKVTMKSDVTLRLENGATVWASGDIADYSKNPKRGEHAYLFVANGGKNIVIAGDGEIVGTGHADLARRANVPKQAHPAHRFSLVHFESCQNVRLRNFTIRDSEAHAVVLNDCENVFITGVSILNNYFRVNSDGIDPISCTNVFISDCHIVAGDDCICPKAENGRAVENLVVNNCILESVSAAFKLGTASSGDFRHVQVANCVIRNSGVGLGLFIKDGGTVEDVSFSNISIETTRPDVPVNSGLRNSIIPIYIDLTKRDPDSPISRIRDVCFSDIQIVGDNSIVIQGLPDRSIENVTLRDITFRVNSAFDFSKRVKREGGESTYRDANRTFFVRQPTYCALAYVNGLTVENVRVLISKEVFDQFPRSALSVFNSENGVIEDVHRDPVSGLNVPPVVVLDHCRHIALDSN